MNKRLPPAMITINGQYLTQTQSEVLRVALILARRDMQAGDKDLLAAGLLSHVDAMLTLFDATEVTL